MRLRVGLTLATCVALVIGVAAARPGQAPDVPLRLVAFAVNMSNVGGGGVK